MGATYRLLALCLTGALTASCALGPNYKRPAVQTPPAYRGETTADAAATSLADTPWSELFHDDVVTQLITRALEHNFDVRAAAERIVQVRELLRIRRSDRWPALDAAASLNATRVSETGIGSVPPGADRDVAYADIGFQLSWELDVWGRLRRLTEAARAQYLATEEARRAIVVTLVADVIETYLRLRGLDLEVEIARRTRDLGTQGLRLTETRRNRGAASGLDVRQAEQLLYTATGQLAGLEREVALTENAMSLLLGRTPGEVPRGLPLEALQTPPSVPAGLPSALLERRPDIRRAEQELIAANAEIGAARAEFFPRISLTSFLGLESRALSDLLTGSAGTWSASGGALAPIFNAGRTRANVRFSESRQREAVVNYQRAIYVALREVSDALAAHKHTGEQRAQQARLVEALRASTRLSIQRYEGGLDSYLPVLDAQRSLFQGELELARLRQQELSAIVRLYRALGGGWEG